MRPSSGRKRIGGSEARRRNGSIQESFAFRYGCIKGPIRPFGTVFSAYSCSTASWLHVDISYYAESALELIF